MKKIVIALLFISLPASAQQQIDPKQQEKLPNGKEYSLLELSRRDTRIISLLDEIYTRDNKIAELEKQIKILMEQKDKK